MNWHPDYALRVLMQAALRPACRLKGVLEEAAAAFFRVLDGYSVADLVAQPGRMRGVLVL